MILGIESSCDESAIAVFDPERGVVFEEIFSQIALHSEYGGVVPELAVREHIKNFRLLFDHFSENFSPATIRSIAVTFEPGLPGCLAIGRVIANTLSMIWNRPAIKVNHLHGHTFSPFLNLHREYGRNFIAELKKFLPHLSLLVSGGNTMLQVVHGNGKIETIAETQDDAAGEAFDKGAKLLGLPYPGGHLIEKFAENGDCARYKFPRAYHDTTERKFSFSGLKTSLRYFLEKKSDIDFELCKNDICASYQEAIVDALLRKVKQCFSADIRSIGLCGGVANNRRLRKKLQTFADGVSLPFFYPDAAHSGDNAAMIAFVAHINDHLTS